MFSSEFFQILRQILTSWQVIAVTIALIMYMKIVSYFSRSYHPKRIKKIRMKKKKNQPAIVEGSIETEDDSDSNDELGLEER